MKVYISGPMTGLTEEDSRARFARVEQAVRAEGLTPINPWDISESDAMRRYARTDGIIHTDGSRIALDADSHSLRQLTVEEKWLAYIHYDLEILARCDLLVHTDGWMHSRGAKIEHYAALGLDIPVCHNLRAFRRWCDATLRGRDESINPRIPSR